MSGFASPELMYAAAELFKEERESTSTIDAFGLAAASLPTVSLTSSFPPSSLLSLLGTHNGGGGGGDDGMFTLIEGTNWDVEDEDEATAVVTDHGEPIFEVEEEAEPIRHATAAAKHNDTARAAVNDSKLDHDAEAIGDVVLPALSAVWPLSPAEPPPVVPPLLPPSPPPEAPPAAFAAPPLTPFDLIDDFIASLPAVVTTTATLPTHSLPDTAALLTTTTSLPIHSVPIAADTPTYRPIL